jgi:hypothetical protein
VPIGTRVEMLVERLIGNATLRVSRQFALPIHAIVAAADTSIVIGMRYDD